MEWRKNSPREVENNWERPWVKVSEEDCCSWLQWNLDYNKNNAFPPVIQEAVVNSGTDLMNLVPLSWLQGHFSSLCFPEDKLEKYLSQAEVKQEREGGTKRENKEKERRMNTSASGPWPVCNGWLIVAIVGELGLWEVFRAGKGNLK